MAAFALIAATAILDFSFSLVLGALLLRCLPAFADTAPAAAPGRQSRLTAACIPACIAAQATCLWLQAAEAAEVPVFSAWGAAWKMASNTSYGHAALSGIAAMAALLAVDRRTAGRRGAGPQVALVLALAFAYARASLSHAAAAGPWSIEVIIEWLHLNSVCLWTGVVTLGAWTLFPSPLPDELSWRRACRMLNAISAIATAALAVLLATGIFNLFRALEHPSQFVTTGYGLVLTLKLALVGLAAALGAFNRFIGFPAVTRIQSHSCLQRGALARLLIVMRAESLMLAAAMAGAATLTTLAAPAMG